MKDTNCEDILINKLALLDGEKPELSAEKIDAHLAACANCRREIEQMETTRLMLGRQSRKAYDADLWPAVGKRIGGEPAEAFRIKWQPFVLLAVLLVAYKLLEMVPARDFGWALKVVPCVLVVALFVFLKENPFRINTELRLEKQL